MGFKTSINTRIRRNGSAQNSCTNKNRLAKNISENKTSKMTVRRNKNILRDKLPSNWTQSPSPFHLPYRFATHLNGPSPSHPWFLKRCPIRLLHRFIPVLPHPITCYVQIKEFTNIQYVYSTSGLRTSSWSSHVFLGYLFWNTSNLRSSHKVRGHESHEFPNVSFAYLHHFRKMLGHQMYFNRRIASISSICISLNFNMYLISNIRVVQTKHGCHSKTKLRSVVASSEAEKELEETMWRDHSSIFVQLTCRRAMTSLVSPLCTEMVLMVVVGARSCCSPSVGTSSTSMFISTSLTVRTVTFLHDHSNTSTLLADSTHTAAVHRAHRYVAPLSTVPKIHERELRNVILCLQHESFVQWRVVTRRV